MLQTTKQRPTPIRSTLARHTQVCLENETLASLTDRADDQFESLIQCELKQALEQISAGNRYVERHHDHVTSEAQKVREK
jgi:hypothetical protein